MPLERDCLLKVKCLEALMPVVLFKPAQRLRGYIYRWLAVALGFFQVGEVLALDPLIFRVVFRHSFSPMLKSLFTVGLILSFSRLRASVIVMSNFPIIAASLARLERRKIMHSQSGQMPLRFPNFTVTGSYSAMSPAGRFGARHRTQ